MRHATLLKSLEILRNFEEHHFEKYPGTAAFDTLHVHQNFFTWAVIVTSSDL